MNPQEKDALRGWFERFKRNMVEVKSFEEYDRLRKEFEDIVNQKEGAV